jgi:hypothetical protein
MSSTTEVTAKVPTKEKNATEVTLKVPTKEKSTTEVTPKKEEVETKYTDWKEVPRGRKGGQQRRNERNNNREKEKQTEEVPAVAEKQVEKKYEPKVGTLAHKVNQTAEKAVVNKTKTTEPKKQEWCPVESYTYDEDGNKVERQKLQMCYDGECRNRHKLDVERKGLKKCKEYNTCYEAGITCRNRLHNYQKIKETLGIPCRYNFSKDGRGNKTGCRNWKCGTGNVKVRHGGFSLPRCPDGADCRQHLLGEGGHVGFLHPYDQLMTRVCRYLTNCTLYQHNAIHALDPKDEPKDCKEGRLCERQFPTTNSKQEDVEPSCKLRHPVSNLMATDSSGRLRGFYKDKYGKRWDDPYASIKEIYAHYENEKE